MSSSNLPTFDLEPIDVVFDSDEVTTSNNATGIRDNPTFIIEPPITDCVGVSLLYANVPFTYYVIDNTNNRFNVTITTGGNTATNAPCTIAPGTYNSQNIGAQVVNALVAGAIAAQAGSAAITNVDAFVDNTDVKLVVRRLTGALTAGDSFTLNFNVSNSAARVLGFAETTYSSSFSSGLFDNQEVAIVGHALKSPRVVNLTGPAQMFLYSDFGSALYGKVRNQKATAPLIGFWPINANYTGTIETFRETPMRIPISSSTISKCTLGLLLGNRIRYNNDGVGDVSYLQLNGEAFQVALRFYRLVPLDRPSIDAAGNSTTTSFSMKGNVYNPASFTQQDVFKRTRRS
jgi:hypothetical protein